jgi:hypothetical protein
MDPALRAAIAGQDEAHSEKENAFVLSMVTGADEHTDYYSDDGDDDATFDASALTNVPEVSQNRSTSTQVTQSQQSQSQPSQNHSKSKSRSAVKRLKPAINAAELTKQNYDLFARALESKCNNQFQLLNENFKTYTRNQERSTVSIVHILNTINTTLGNVTKFQAYNTPTAKAKLETNRHSIGQQIQTICLDSSPESADKTSSSSNSTLPAISLSHLRPYKWEAELDQANNASPFAQQVKQELPPPQHYHLITIILKIIIFN